MATIVDKFPDMCREAGITHITSVPDGYLAPLIKAIEHNGGFTHVPAAREEECLGIASGLAMSGKRALVMMQNVGFLNSIGCYATLCANYRTPFGILIAHRGNVFDQNSYDIPKIRHWNNVMTGLNALTTSWYAYQSETDILKKIMEQAFTAHEPAFLLLDMPPQNEVAC